jgi:hypothetical protein
MLVYANVYYKVKNHNKRSKTIWSKSSNSATYSQYVAFDKLVFFSKPQFLHK